MGRYAMTVVWASVMALGLLACGDGGGAPRFVDPGPQVAVVAEPYLLSIIASDPDGDPIEYDFTSSTLTDLHVDGGITVAPNGQALFSWQPQAADLGQHVIDFIASDGDNESRLSVDFDVRGAAGDGTAPVFLKPLGEGIFLDLRVEPCVYRLEIEVHDPDDAEVELTMQDPPLGELEAAPDGLSGIWNWCPNAEQRAAAGTYELVLQADDGDNPPTVKHFSIHLDRGECASQPPTVSHSVSDFEQLADLELLASAGDDIGLLDVPSLMWSTELVDPQEMTLESMKLVAGDLRNGTFGFRMTNPAVPLGPGGISSLYYRIAVVDEDNCVAYSPPEGVHDITVTNPGGDGGGVCQPCSWDAQCGGPSDLCLQLGVETVACGRACASEADCDAGFSCTPGAVTSIEGATGRQCIPDSGICDVDECQDDMGEPNDTLQQALSQPAIEEGWLHDYHLCPHDDDWYRIELPFSARVLAEIADALPVPDLDLQLTTGGGQMQAISNGPDSNEVLASECLPAGTYALRVFTIYDDPATYDLGYVLEPC